VPTGRRGGEDTAASFLNVAVKPNQYFVGPKEKSFFDPHARHDLYWPISLVARASMKLPAYV
jgi:hypothetical protein